MARERSYRSRLHLLAHCLARHLHIGVVSDMGQVRCIINQLCRNTSILIGLPQRHSPHPHRSRSPFHPSYDPLVVHLFAFALDGGDELFLLGGQVLRIQ